jgi:hypothetical protein
VAFSVAWQLGHIWFVVWMLDVSASACMMVMQQDKGLVLCPGSQKGTQPGMPWLAEAANVWGI